LRRQQAQAQEAEAETATQMMQAEALGNAAPMVKALGGAELLS
jgi:hypothetical protein